MNRFGLLFVKIQNMFTACCEFKGICSYFDPNQFTCANKGGSHCGKYRRFKAETAPNEPAKPSETT